MLPCVLAFTVALPAGAAETPTATGSTQVRYEAYGRVLQVINATTVVVNRGRAEGLTREAEDLGVYPMRMDLLGEKRSLGYPVRLARAKVESLEEHTARLKLSVVTSPVQVGDAFTYRLPVDEAQRDDPLFELSLMDVALLPLGEETSLYGLAELRGAPPEAWRTRVLDALLAELQARADLAPGVRPQRIEGGRFHGKTMQEAFKATTHEDLLAFAHYLLDSTGTYACTSWVLVNVYGTWLINGTPTAVPKALVRRVRSLMEKGDTEVAAGRFMEAEELYRRGLESLPDDKQLRERLDSMINLRVWDALLEKDPDDTETRWKRMRTCFERGAYATVVQELERLDKAGYRPDSVLRYRGFVACRQQRFDEAERIFKQLLARGPDKELSQWRESCQQLEQLEARPGSVRTLLARAEQQEAQGFWDSAQTRYLSALDAAKTKAEIDQARKGQERVALLSELDTVERWAKDDIAQHDLPHARKRVTQLLALCDRARKPGCAEERLGRLATEANDSFEEALAIELRREQIRRAPRNVAAHQDLAWLLLAEGRLEQAATALDAAQALDPARPFTAHMQASLRLEQGRLAEARAFTEKALADKSYAWPRLFMAKLHAIEGRHEEAVRWAKEAHALMPEESQMRTALQATLRAEEASRAIARGQDVARNRLRLVRSLADLGLGQRARSEAQALRGTPYHADAHWAIVSTISSAVRLPLKDSVADELRADTPDRERTLALLRARVAWRERPEDAQARMALARALLVTGSFHEALAVLAPLLVDAEGKEGKNLAANDLAELARRGQQAQAFQEVARQAARREDYKTAEHYAARAQELAEAVGYKSLVFYMAAWRASSLSSLGHHDEGLRILRPLLEAVRADGQPRTLQELELRAANIESNKGSLESVSQALSRGRASCEALDDEVCLARIHKDLARVESTAGRLVSARRELERALQLARQTGQSSLERETLGALSDVARMMSEPKQSRELAEDMLRRSREALDSHNERYALLILGALAMGQGDAAEARARFEEAYRLGQRTGDTWTRAQARLWLGNASLLVARDPRAALESYQQAVVLYGGLEDAIGQATALTGEGEARAALGDFDRAREALVSVIELGRKHKRMVTVGHAQAELALLEVQRGQLEAARAAADEAVRLAESFDIPEERWLAYYSLARALDVGGKKAEAFTSYDKAVAELGRVIGSVSGEADRDRLLSYGRRRQVFQQAIELALHLGRTERALELLQQSHDTRLRQMFDSTGVKAQDGQLQETLQQLGEAESKTRAARQQLSEEYSKPPELRSDARIQALSKVVASTQEEMRQQLVDLKAEHRQLYKLLAINPQSISEVRSALPEGTLVVVYFIASDALYAFLLTRDQERTQVVKVSVSPSQVDEAVFAYHSALVEEGEEVGALSSQLHGWLIAPIEAEMARAKTTLVVPFGSLYYLPFHALAAPDASGRPVYVLEKHRLGYLSSTTFFKLMSPHREVRERRLLGFANPDGSLTSSREELKRITTESFPNARVLYGQEATKKSFLELAGGYDILHFATHGVLSRDPRASHLKLAGEPLTVRDINGLEGLEGKTGLVVLSACETAMEHGNDAGDEFISLASAFGTAGSPAIVASLWKVNDKATSELMASFYAQLRKAPQVDTLEALRQAQLHVMRMEDEKGVRRYQHPGLWAAFELIGDFR